ncbi:MAG: hypothetical protein IPI46_00075 [Bacteroidetes bacterium]|nr:hypothetical protein [Bacteroidota bacterium]
MKNIILIAFILMNSTIHAQVAADWYNYPSGVSIATDSINNVYTAYWDYNPGGDITLTKRDALGNIMWNATYNNTDNTRHEMATWVETDHAGNIIVSGTIQSGYSSPVNAASVLMKYNSSGILLWRVVYESSFDGSSTKKCLIDANDNIYVLGIGTGPSGQVTKVKKFNSLGTPIWNYFDTGIGAPITFKFTPDGKIIIVHRTTTGILNGYSKIDLNGNNMWSLTGVSSSTVGDAAGDAFGNTYIVNGSPSSLKKLSPSGSLLWTQANSFSGNKVEVGSDNNPVVGGYQSAGYGVVIKKYDSSGNLLWQNLDADGPSLALLAITPMRIDACDNIYIAGSTMSSMGMCKVNSNGTSGWNATTPSGYPVWFDFGTDNKIYITGGTTARFNNTPCHSVQLKLFMEGYYIGGGLMSSVLFNQGVTSNLGITDSIQIQLRNSTFPHSLVAQTKTLLNINGTATCYFPIPNGNYYVVIRHRNSVETWSSNPITFSGLINYDFTTAQGQAYGSNQTEVEIGV